MITVGIDAHKKTHTMCAVDPGGKKLGEKTFDTTSDGHFAALSWAHNEFGRELIWAVEDSRAMTARLERDLINAGQTVIRVPPHLMARHRRSGRVFGKSDPIDALATAHASQREPGLPIARHHVGSRHMKLLVDRRDDLVQHRTAVIQRLLWRIHELDPAYHLKPGQVKWTPTQEALGGWLAVQPGLVAELARDELAEIVRLTPIIRTLEKRIRTRIREVAPSLLALYGCGAFTAGRIIGEAADVTRFRSEAAFARYVGLAPVPNWSGSTHGRMRSYRGGNRQLNAAIHQIAMTQIKKGGPSENYYRRRRAERDLHGYALDGVKRRVARTVFNRLRADQQPPSFDALLAELQRRNDIWAAQLPVETRPVWPTSVPAIDRLQQTPPDPLFAEAARITDAWEAALQHFG
jgi:transposase